MKQQFPSTHSSTARPPDSSSIGVKGRRRYILAARTNPPKSRIVSRLASSVSAFSTPSSKRGRPSYTRGSTNPSVKVVSSTQTGWFLPTVEKLAPPPPRSSRTRFFVRPTREKSRKRVFFSLPSGEILLVFLSFRLSLPCIY